MDSRDQLGDLISEEYLLDVTTGDEEQGLIKGAPETSAVLLCPLCLKEYPDGRGMWLHQTGVEAFFRYEDHEEGVHGYIADTKSFLTVNGDCGRTSRNPSARRDGLIIYFSCEWHSPNIILELHISQHKGVTAMGWLVKEYRSRLDTELGHIFGEA